MSTSSETSARPAVPPSMPLEVPAETPRWIPDREALRISEPSYRWTARLFRLLEQILKVNLWLHEPDRIEAGEIFLFNHFARFETFIPQYFIYRHCGAFSRSIASAEFFGPDDAFSRYLLGVGAVPNQLPGLLPFLAAEALRGRKIIVFPEGGMVKDRRVVDEAGGYSVYSRSARSRRKHHSGAAVLALGLDAFKFAVAEAARRGDGRRLKSFAEALEMTPDALISACRRPTTIVPSNITFYPIRVGENLLSKGAELISRGMSRRLSEELMIEGNILLKHTDMDIHLGRPVRASRYWRWWERPFLKRASKRIERLSDAFEFAPDRGPLDTRVLARSMRVEAVRIRDDYMHRMYTTVSVNLSHLASVLVLGMVERDQKRVEATRFHRLLYAAVKSVQRLGGVHLHRSLRNPEAYLGLLDGRCQGFAQFLRTTMRLRLIERDSDGYRFLPKLQKEHHFDEIRLENPVEVYANEIVPLPQVGRALTRVLDEARAEEGARLADHLADDEERAYEWDREVFSRPRHEALNALETATAPGAPYLLEPSVKPKFGVVLVHGFLASPAEMRGLAHRLLDTGFAVYAVRLKGHGTSPWDLRERSFEEWLASVRRGLAILRGHATRIALIGFSTGGALCLHLAGEDPDIAGVCAACVPVRFRNPHMRFVPLMHGANRLVRRLSSLDGVKSFTVNESENPHINYRHMPMRGLYELRRLVDSMLPRLSAVRCPVALLQATEDPVVVPDSVHTVSARLSAAPVEVAWVESDRHGIVHAEIGDTHERIVAFTQKLASEH